MATKIELTIAPNYVPNWTIVDAIRELFQNALDQEVQAPGNTMSFDYDDSTEALTISNKKSTLTADTLLLGTTSKVNNPDTIGQFGEGYKIATLVLLREGKNITFYNYGAKETWRPRFVKSRKFGTDILTFFIEKSAVWSSIPDANLTIVVSGITSDEYYNQIMPSNLHLMTDYEVIEETEYGDVINVPGKVYINGLFVCDYTPYKYGYNFKPGYLRLDRDRKMASDFDLRWVASKVWSTLSIRSDEVFKMLEEDAADVAYLNDVYCGDIDAWRNLMRDKFIEAYGPEAIPVTTQTELSRVPNGYKGIVVSNAYGTMLRTRITMPVLIEDNEEPTKRLKDWMNEMILKYGISQEDVDEFNEIMEDL